jgi:hypothetical protein
MEPEFSGIAGANDDVTAGVAAATITGIDDWAHSTPARTKVARMDKALARILFAASAGINSRHPKVFRDRGEFGFNLRLILRDRDLLILHFFGDGEDLLFLLPARVWSFGRGGSHEERHREKGGKSWKAFHGAESVDLA